MSQSKSNYPEISVQETIVITLSLSQSSSPGTRLVSEAANLVYSGSRMHYMKNGGSTHMATGISRSLSHSS